MADPATLAMITMGTTAAGGIIGAIGSRYSGAAQANLFNYQAGVAQANQLLAKQDANYTLASGEVSAQQSGMKTRAQVGETRAGFGAGNVAGGSANAVERSETEIGAENQALIRSNAAKRAFGFEVEAAKDTAQGTMYQTAARTARTAGDISALSTIIGSAGQVASKWLQYKQYFGSGDSGGPMGIPTTELEMA